MLAGFTCHACGSVDVVDYWHNNKPSLRSKLLANTFAMLQRIYPHATRCVDCGHVAYDGRPRKKVELASGRTASSWTEAAAIALATPVLPGLGLDSPVKYLMHKDPDLSVEEAKAQIAQNQGEFAEVLVKQRAMRAMGYPHPHAFRRLTSASVFNGPADETCDLCGCDPRNLIHRAQ